jgi:hypothetical protein
MNKLLHMKSKALYIVAALFFTVNVSAATKTFTILGDQKIKAEVQGGMPLPAEKNGIKVIGAGFVMGKGELTWAFNFTSQKPVTKVSVEDVSEKAAVLLVEDEKPSLKEDMWSGQAGSIAITKADSPWIFTRGDTTKVFRFSITLSGESEPTVIYQPAVYPKDTKKLLQQFAL